VAFAPVPKEALMNHEARFPHRLFDEGTSQYRLLIEPRSQRYGCGIYEAGANGLRVFATDSGRVLPIQRRIITDEDLMEVYVWGRLDAEIAAGTRDSDSYDFFVEPDESA
jgi:hypothetical protein